MSNGPVAETYKERLKSTGRRVGEYGVALLLVLCFFLSFLGILGILFPSGLGLGDLMRIRDLSLAGREEGGGWEHVAIPGWEGQPAGKTPQAIAVLSTLRNEVKSRGAGSIAWQQAVVGMRLASRDAVQTSRQSGASIRFSGKDSIEMGENSLVILRKVEQDPVRLTKRSTLLVIDGEFRGNLGGAEKQTFDFELGKSGARARIASGGEGGGPAEFQINVNPDRTTTLSMYKGSADVAASGTTVRLEANTATTVLESGAASAPVALPSSPVLSSPANDAVFFYRSLPPIVSLAWNVLEGTDSYRIVLARDREFRDIVAREDLVRPSFVHGNLKEGTYYWRVSGKKKWAEGPPSGTGQLRIVKDTLAPDLRVEAAGGGDGKERGLLKGASEPGATVFVAGNRVPVAETGDFECDVKLARGVNQIVVEAVDPAGNVAYRTMRLNRTF